MTDPNKLNCHPLCQFFLSEYLRRNSQDQLNFPDNGAFGRYEELFRTALKVLELQMGDLRKYPEFNFDAGVPQNLEASIGVLRVVLFLHQKGFRQIRLLKATKTTGADIECEKNGKRVCCEVKTITKQSAGRPGEFLEEQLYSKLWDVLPKAKDQLKAATIELKCSVAIVIFVVNWIVHSIVLAPDTFQWIVDRLDREGDTEGVDGIVLVLAGGHAHGFLSERIKDL